MKLNVQLKECDYVQCEFIEFKSKDEYLENIKDLDESNQNFKHGIIAEIKVNNEYEYVYSSNNQKGEENLKEMKEFLINNNFKIIYWKLKLINVQKVNFNEEKWKNDIQDKINNFHEVYMIEKKLSNPINLFIKDDE